MKMTAAGVGIACCLLWLLALKLGELKEREQRREEWRRLARQFRDQERKQMRRAAGTSRWRKL